MSGEDCIRNLSPLKLDHACVYVVYIDEYDTFKHATVTGAGVDVVVGAGVVVVVTAALVEEVDVVSAGVVVRNGAVVSTNTKLVVLLALADTFVPLPTGAGVVVRAALVDVLVRAALVDVGAGVVVDVVGAGVVVDVVGAGVVVVVVV